MQLERRSDNSVREIPLTRGLVALVDAADYEVVSRFKWHARPKPNGFYAGRIDRSSGRPRLIYLHRQIIGPGVDHRNRNPLDCRRENLRPCTQQQNCFNRGKSKGKSSRYRGVSRDGRGWRAYIRHNGFLRYLGNFPSEIDAARAYDSQACSLFGEFANLNFPL